MECKGLLSGVVAVAGLNEQSLLVEAEIDLVVSGGGGFLGRGVAEPVLGAKLFGDLVVDLGHGQVLLDFEETATGLLGHALEDFFAVGMASATGVVATVVATTISSARIAATTGITASARISAATTSAG